MGEHLLVVSLVIFFVPAFVACRENSATAPESAAAAGCPEAHSRGAVVPSGPCSSGDDYCFTQDEPCPGAPQGKQTDYRCTCESGSIACRVLGRTRGTCSAVPDASLPSGTKYCGATPDTVPSGACAIVPDECFACVGATTLACSCVADEAGLAWSCVSVRENVVCAADAGQD